jgi:hypothetical protein
MVEWICRNPKNAAGMTFSDATSTTTSGYSKRTWIKNKNCSAQAEKRRND